MSRVPREAQYVCGHDARELARLAVQEAIYGDVTAVALARAGIGPGLRVVDVGCGAGDVSLRVGALVGPSGVVHAVDRSAEAAATTRARAAAVGLSRVVAQVADLATWVPEAPVDAVVGRFVLMHQADPVALVARARTWLRSGGRLVFIESDLAALLPDAHSRPPSPTYGRVVGLWCATLERAGAHADMGRRLPEAFVAAGLPRPDTMRWTYESGDATGPMFRFASEGLRSMRGAAAAAGLDVPGEAEMDALEATLRDEVVGQGGVLAAPPAVAAWTRAPLTTAR